MKPLWILLLALAMVAPTATAWTWPVQDECQDESDCEQGGRCDFDCALCICCAHRTQGVTTSIITAPPGEVPASPAHAIHLEPPTAPTTDILHVPKSV
jgi:hypothetical protein